MKKKYTILILLVFLASFSRIVPHVPNFTPIGAIALFSASYFSNKYLAFISNAWNVARKEWGINLPDNPVSMIKKPVVKNRRDRLLTSEEYEKLIFVLYLLIENMPLFLHQHFLIHMLIL